MSASESLGSGAVAGFASVLALQPLDVLKTRLQEMPRHSTTWNKRVMAVVQNTVRNDGIRPTLIRNVPGVAVYFATLQQLQYLVLLANRRGFPYFYDEAGQKLSTAGNLLVGASARTFAGALLMPATVLKVRFESSTYNYRTLSEALRNILAQDGVRGLFRGLGATALRDAPHAGLYLAFYRMVRWEGVGGTMVGGAVAGALATACTQPFDLAKTRVQLARGKTDFITVLRAVAKNEGIAGLFSGIGPRLVRKSLSQAFTWTVYEELMRHCKSLK
ncbi:Solute carrier family 25 member 38 [Paramicrosporidium saccamoebae]|uniref:Solute carrier family 25 member 38 n=1 Tax=Paramicrosporidium saccamoebae TaxID=1246581 RepID=A0A2H9TIM6_9FUNG|nr:Solute carrier family 25 member 38 [Paramicrosporidium saccamoebae]